MTREEIIDYQKRWREFVATPVGAAFQKFESLHAIAWQRDTELGFDGRGAYSARESWEKANKARSELLRLLGMEGP